MGRVGITWIKQFFCCLNALQGWFCGLQLAPVFEELQRGQLKTTKMSFSSGRRFVHAKNPLADPMTVAQRWQENQAEKSAKIVFFCHFLMTFPKRWMIYPKELSWWHLWIEFSKIGWWISIQKPLAFSGPSPWFFYGIMESLIHSCVFGCESIYGWIFPIETRRWWFCPSKSVETKKDMSWTNYQNSKKTQLKTLTHTVDGWNLAPPGMYETL